MVTCCSTGPVVAASEQMFAIDDREFVMHVITGAVGADWDAGDVHARDVGAIVERFIIIGNQADGNALSMSANECFSDVVVGDSENTDIDGALGVLDDLVQ